jgi:hypothetical protein
MTDKAFLVEYNHNGSGPDYFETMAVAHSSEGAEILKQALTLKYRNGKLRIRPLAVEDGTEEKYASWLRNVKEE